MLAIRELTGNVRRLRVGLAVDATWVVDDDDGGADFAGGDGDMTRLQPTVQ